jgi:ankyrin repeat protein
MFKRFFTNGSKIIVSGVLLAGLFFVPGAGLAAMSTEDFCDVCQEGTPQQIEAAIQAGAEVDAKEEDGRTPLMWAANSGNVEALSLLLAAGADVNAKDAARWTPLMYAVADSNLEAVSLLLGAGADPDMKDNWGQTAKDRAVRKGYNDIVAVLDAWKKENR